MTWCGTMYDMIRYDKICIYISKSCTTIIYFIPSSYIWNLWGPNHSQCPCPTATAQGQPKDTLPCPSIDAFSLAEWWISIPHQAFCYLIGINHVEKPQFPSVTQHIDMWKSNSTDTRRLRLAVHAVLCLHPDSVSLLGPDCGSWGIPARYTTMRSFINAWGAMWLPFVSGANQTIGLTLDCTI